MNYGKIWSAFQTYATKFHPIPIQGSVVAVSLLMVSAFMPGRDANTPPSTPSPATYRPQDVAPRDREALRQAGQTTLPAAAEDTIVALIPSVQANPAGAGAGAPGGGSGGGGGSSAQKPAKSAPQQQQSALKPLFNQHTQFQTATGGRTPQYVHPAPSAPAPAPAVAKPPVMAPYAQAPQVHTVFPFALIMSPRNNGYFPGRPFFPGSYGGPRYGGGRMYASGGYGRHR